MQLANPRNSHSHSTFVISELPMTDHGHDGSIARLGSAIEQIIQQLSHVIVGQNDVIEEMLIALFTRGHCLLEGVPGLAKTLMISTLARSLNLTFSRIQFTPDLMPADITGTDIIEENRSTGQREFRFLAGPIFSHVILADEINRTPPKTQAALLEAMQERQVTVGRVRHQLSDPFFVLATQNPIEQEGTYPLPEAQQDRFMFKVFVTYPSFQEEFEVARRTTATRPNRSKPCCRPRKFASCKSWCERADQRSRDSLHAGAGPANPRARSGRARFHSRSVGLGAGPRAVQFLILGAKARALVHGRTHVALEDIRALAKPVLRHRMVVNFAAESEGITSDDIIDRLLDVTPTQEDELIHDARFQKIFAS